MEDKNDPANCIKKRSIRKGLALVLASVLFLTGCGLTSDLKDMLGSSEQSQTVDETEPADVQEDEPASEEAAADTSEEDTELQNSYEGSSDFEVDEQVEDTGESDSEGIDGLTEYSDEDIAEAGAAQSGLYAYEQLSQDEKLVYKQIYLTLMNMADSVKIDCDDTDRLNVIFQCVMMDHPEIFWVNGYTFTKYTQGDALKAIGFKGCYTLTEAERESRQGAIDSYVSNCLSQVPEGDDYTKIRYVYEYLIANTEYDLNAEDNQNICSVFLNGRSVCQGYAKATQYLLNRLGIGATLVTGTTSNGESHAWNLVSSDGSYYYVDTTWGDASYKLEDGAAGKVPSITYDYLCVTSADLARTHSANTVVALPNCSSLSDNYYVREGAYFNTVDTDMLSALFSRAVAAGKEYVTVKCSDENVYASMRQYLISDQNIFSYLPEGSGTVSYWETADQCSISFWL